MAQKLDKNQLLALAQSAGFSNAGISRIELPEIDRQRLQNWLTKQFHGAMSYMDKPGIDRCHGKTLADYGQSVLMVSLDYPPALQLNSDPDIGYISTYARSEDYHFVFKRKLNELIEKLHAIDPELQARPFVDSAPIIERAFAREAGIGWTGKNACLIHKSQGSYFFLGGLVLSQQFENDSAVTDHCGRCTLCIQACPTDAIVGPGQVDARLCISYLTIELKGPWPEHLRAQTGNHIFGCDICQVVCPWNQKFSTAQLNLAFPDHGNKIQSGPLEQLFDQAMASFKKMTRNTPLARPGKKGLLRNIVTAMGNSQNPKFRERLQQAQSFSDPAVQEHAAWALKRINEATQS